MELRPLAMGDQIADRLRVDIIKGAILDDTHLAEDGLAARFDVSRGPVRDALRQLEVEGLVESRRKRIYARALGLRDVEDLYTLREALESLAIRLAVGRASDSDWDRVQGIVDEMEAAGVAGDAERFARADMAFHTAFYVIADNRRLLEAWRPYQRTFSVLFEMSDTPDIASATDDHQGFLDVVRGGDVEAALLRLQDHLASAKAHVRTALTARDDLVSANA